MGVFGSVQKQVRRFEAGGRSTLGVAAGGIGSDLLMRAIDGVFGSPVQKIFSFNIPVLGTIGPIDILNYMIYAGGLKVSKRGLIAVGAAKLVGGALTNIGPIALPGSAGINLSEQASVAAGQAGAPT